MNTLRIKKGTILQRPGEFNSKMYLIVSGLLRSYFIDCNGKEHIFLFAVENSVMVDHIPPNSPTELFIDALEDTQVIVLEKSSWNVHNNMMEMLERIDMLQKRVIMNMGESIHDRYHYFIHMYPEIVSRIPQKMIASYIEVTPEALSKSKKKK